MKHSQWIKDPRYEAVTKFREEQKRKAKNFRQTKAWKDKAKKFKEGKVCHCCGKSDDLQVHHMTNKEYELLLDDSCLVLCKGCHYLVHHGHSVFGLVEYYKKNPKSSS